MKWLYIFFVTWIVALFIAAETDYGKSTKTIIIQDKKCLKCGKEMPNLNDTIYVLIDK